MQIRGPTKNQKKKKIVIGRLFYAELKICITFFRFVWKFKGKTFSLFMYWKIKILKIIIPPEDLIRNYTSWLLSYATQLSLLLQVKSFLGFFYSKYCIIENWVLRAAKRVPLSSLVRVELLGVGSRPDHCYCNLTFFFTNTRQSLALNKLPYRETKVLFSFLIIKKKNQRKCFVLTLYDGNKVATDKTQWQILHEQARIK